MVTSTFSKADVLYRKIIRNTFFRQGWGTLDIFRNMQRLKRDMFNAEKFKEMVYMNESIKIDKVREVRDAYSVVDGHFLSPLAKYYPGLLPKESEVAKFQAIIPSSINYSAERVPMCVMLAGTGDHYFWRRRNLVAKPLIKDNSIGSVMLVNPYYGCRKPKTQTRSSLNHVVDLFIMGCALIVETSVLLNWCEYQGLGPLGVTGVSLGGHMASLAATFVPKPLAVVPCLSWTTASSAFTEGVLGNAVAWSILESQLEDFNFLEELCHICHEVEMDGINARKFQAANSRAGYSPNFPHELLNISSRNTTIEPSLDLPINVFNEDEESSCESVPLQAVLTGESFKNQTKLKSKLLSQISLLKPGLHSTKGKKYEKAWSFMKYILNITTHLAFYREPVEPRLAVFVEAEFDGYIPRKNCLSPVDLWPGCQIKYAKCGHVAAALYKQNMFRETIAETLNKMP